MCYSVSIFVYLATQPSVYMPFFRLDKHGIFPQVIGGVMISESRSIFFPVRVLVCSSAIYSYIASLYMLPVMRLFRTVSRQDKKAWKSFDIAPPFHRSVCLDLFFISNILIFRMFLWCPPEVVFSFYNLFDCATNTLTKPNASICASLSWQFYPLSPVFQGSSHRVLLFFSLLLLSWPLLWRFYMLPFPKSVPLPLLSTPVNSIIIPFTFAIFRRYR